MSLDFIRALCLSIPHVTEEIQWEDHLLFKIGGRMFAITTLGPIGNRLSVKSTPEKFAELTEIPGVIPAPYMARSHWVALERWDALRRTEIEELVRQSFALIFAKLPKKKQAELTATIAPKRTAPKAAKQTSKPKKPGKPKPVAKPKKQTKARR